MILADMLKTERKKLGLTQDEVAEKLIVSRQAISKWEQGNGYPDIENLVRLSDLYNISLDELLRGEKHVTTPLRIGTYFGRRKLVKNIFFLTLIVIFFFYGALEIAPFAWIFAMLIGLIIIIYKKTPNYWVLEKDGIRHSTRKNIFVSVFRFFSMLFFGNDERFNSFTPYSEIESITLTYYPAPVVWNMNAYLWNPIVKFDSPENVNSGYNFKVTTKNGEIFRSQLKEIDAYSYLLSVTNFFKKQKIEIIDPREIQTTFDKLAPRELGSNDFDYILVLKEKHLNLDDFPKLKTLGKWVPLDKNGLFRCTSRLRKDVFSKQLFEITALEEKDYELSWMEHRFYNTRFLRW